MDFEMILGVPFFYSNSQSIILWCTVDTSKVKISQIFVAVSEYTNFIRYSAFILWFDDFLDSGAEICEIFRVFLGENLRHQRDILKLSDL